MIPDARGNPSAVTAGFDQPLRWITTRKVWRAFPELDPFSDAECKRFIDASTRRLLVQAQCIVLAAGGTIASGIGLLIFLGAAQGSAAYLPRGEANLRILFTFMIGTVACSFPFIITLLLRDFVLRRAVHHTLKTGCTCTTCGYSLLGLPVDPSHHATCPECGVAQHVHAALAALAQPSGQATPREPPIST